MSKNGFKKFKKNDYSYEEEEYENKPRSNYLDRKNQRKMERALRTKDAFALTEEELEFEDDLNDVQSEVDRSNSIRGL